MKFKFLILLSFIAFTSLDSLAQNNNELDSIVNASLMEYVKLADKHIYKIRNEDIDETDIARFKNQCIDLYTFPRGFKLSEEIINLGFQYVPQKSVDSRKIRKQSNINIECSPIELDGNEITIRIARNGMSVKGRRIYLSVGGFWVTCIWSYDGQTNRWILKSSKMGGI